MDQDRSVIKKMYFLVASLVIMTGCQSEQQPYRLQTLLDEQFANEQFPVRRINRSKFSAELLPTDVPAPAGYAPETIVIDTSRKFLYLIQQNGKARRYGIAVGGAGYDWHGTAVIGRKAKWPSWYPTDDMHQQTAGLPKRIEPGPHNPLGARALYLYQNGKDTLYRIHGTSEPWTIGTNASSGCIRMFNEDIIELFSNINIGATVIVN